MLCIAVSYSFSYSISALSSSSSRSIVFCCGNVRQVNYMRNTITPNVVPGRGGSDPCDHPVRTSVNSVGRHACVSALRGEYRECSQGGVVCVLSAEQQQSESCDGQKYIFLCKLVILRVRISRVRAGELRGLPRHKPEPRKRNDRRKHKHNVLIARR